jgi:hypothetical protein
MGRKLLIALVGSVLVLGSSVVEAGAASAQAAPGLCDLSADELAGFPVITLQHDLYCSALPASADGAFWLNLNGHALHLSGDLNGTTPVVISNGSLILNDSELHEIDHTVLWQVTVVGPEGLFQVIAPPTVVYRGPAIVDSTIGGANLTVEPTGHSIVLQRDTFLANKLETGLRPVTVVDDATTGQPVGPLTVDIQNNLGDMGIAVRADTIASGQIADNLFINDPGLQVQGGAVQQLAVTGNVAVLAPGPGISITGAGAANVTDGGGNRDIWNLVTGAGVPNCIGIVCSPS